MSRDVGVAGPATGRLASIFLASLLVSVSGCGGDAERPIESGESNSLVDSADSSRADGAKRGRTDSDRADDLQSALAAAREVEVPDVEVRREFGRVETIHELLGAAGFVETVQARARQRSGATYSLDMRIVHRPVEPSYRMTAAIEQTGGQTEQLRQIVEMTPYGRMNLVTAVRVGGEFEQIRVGERYWERMAGEEWLAATELPEMRSFGSEPPVASLSKAVDGSNVLKYLDAPIGKEEIQGLGTTHHRLEGILLFRPLWNGLAMPGAPRPPPETPAVEAGPGVADIWITEAGIVVRAELRLENEHEDVYEATLELTDFGEQPEIQPPN